MHPAAAEVLRFHSTRYEYQSEHWLAVPVQRTECHRSILIWLITRYHIGSIYEDDLLLSVTAAALCRENAVLYLYMFLCPREFFSPVPATLTPSTIRQRRLMIGFWVGETLFSCRRTVEFLDRETLRTYDV